jgi:hypothetical protein
MLAQSVRMHLYKVSPIVIIVGLITTPSYGVIWIIAAFLIMLMASFEFCSNCHRSFLIVGLPVRNADGNLVCNTCKDAGGAG